MRNTTRTANLVMTALMIGIIIVSIMFIRIPIPGTQGYVHLGDAMIDTGLEKWSDGRGHWRSTRGYYGRSAGLGALDLCH